MTKRELGLLYEVTEFILSNGSIADRLRLLYAQPGISDKVLRETLSALESVLNKDGGVPFAIRAGNPSSVKETSEIMTLLLELKNPAPGLTERMVQFLVSRQKNDGGFSETLNLAPLIEDRYGKTTPAEWYPVGKSITWLTGKALESLILAGYSDTERLQRAQRFLEELQNEDGHWPDYKGAQESDPLGTGNILPALRAAGVSPKAKVYVDGRAALYQHLKNSIDSGSYADMVDLAALDKAITPQEKEVVEKGVALIIKTQNPDGGWSAPGSKKSDAELTSLLIYALAKCRGLIKQR